MSFLLCFIIGVVGSPLIYGQTASVIYNSGAGIYDGFWAIEATDDAIYTYNITDANCDSTAGCAELIKFDFDGEIIAKTFFPDQISDFEAFDFNGEELVFVSATNNGNYLKDNQITLLSVNLEKIDSSTLQSSPMRNNGVISYEPYNVVFGSTQFSNQDLQAAMRWSNPVAGVDTIIYLQDSILHIQEAKIDHNGLLTIVYNKNEGAIYSSFGLMKFDQEMNEVWRWESGDSVAQVFFYSYDLEILDDNSMVYTYDGKDSYNATYAKRVSAEGEVIWERDLMYRYTNEFMWNVFHIGSFNDILRTSDNNLLLVGSERDKDDNGYVEEIAFMMKINSDDGSVMWTRWFRDWDEEGVLKPSVLLEARELPDGRLAIAGSSIGESFDGMLLITEDDGCLVSDCREVQNLSEQPETDFIYEGNVWHVVKEDTLGNIVDEYSYTFAEDTVAIYNGAYSRELLKSDDGGNSWQAKGRYYSNAGGNSCGVAPSLEPVFGFTQYEFQPCCRFVRLETGGETRPDLMDTIILLDGSEKLRYYENPSPFCDNPLEMIEHVGSITTDPFFPTNDCSSDTLTRVTCLVKDGIVIYANPDYTQCMPVSVQDQLTEIEINIYPNPASNYIVVESERTIEDIELYTINGLKIGVESNHNVVDTSNLPAGLYLLKVIVKGSIEVNKMLVIE